MSTTVEIPEAAQTAEQLLQLVSEYAEKLNRVKEKAFKVDSRTVAGKANGPERFMRVRDLSEYLRYLRPPAEQLIRQASQFVEHGAIKDTTRLELRLRLAELEHALLSATQVIREVER